MNSIDAAVGQVVAAQQTALKSRIHFAVEAAQLDVVRLKGDTITEMLQATDRSAHRDGRGRLFNATA